MDTPSKLPLIRRGPGITLLLAGGAWVVAAFPGWAGGLMYDRQAILDGELWRLFTGHWVHFSTSHLVCDTLALGLVGGMLEARRTPGCGRLCLLAPWVINLALLACATAAACPGWPPAPSCTWRWTVWATHRGGVGPVG
jgi:membrane associated rhomboid family serine protease